MSENNHIEITLKSQEDEGGTIDLWALKRHFGNLKGFAVLLLVGALILGLAVGVIKDFVTAENQVQTLVSFGFDGIEKGQDPDGAVFDITKMSAPMVVEPALQTVGVSGEVRADTIRQAMSFEGVIPQEALDRISVTQTIAEKDPKALEELLDLSYHPVEFLVSLDLKKAGLEKTTGIQLLNAINTAYQDWFFQTYSHQEALAASVGGMDYSSYDYSEAADMLKIQIRTANRYVERLQKLAPTFRSTETSLTFADLSSNLDVLLTVDIPKLNALIIENRLTKDAATLEAYYSYQIRTATNNLEEAQERLTSVNTAIEAYEKSTAVVYGTGEAAATTVTNNSEAYDDLFAQKVAASDNVASLRARLKELQQVYAALTTSAETTPAVTPNAKAIVETLLDSIPEKLSQCIQDINDTATEYYETVAIRDAFQIQVPARKTGGVSLISMAKSGLICAAVLMVASCIVIAGIAATRTAFETAPAEDKRRKRSKRDRITAPESESLK